jgi:hypothetical protein
MRRENNFVHWQIHVQELCGTLEVSMKDQGRCQQFLLSNSFWNIRPSVRILTLSSFGVATSRHSDGHMWGLGPWGLVLFPNAGVRDSKLEHQSPWRTIPKLPSIVLYASLKTPLPFHLAGNGYTAHPPRETKEEHGWFVMKI